MANAKLSALGDRGVVLGTDIVYVVNPLTGLFYKATVDELKTYISSGGASSGLSNGQSLLLASGNFSQ